MGNALKCCSTLDSGRVRQSRKTMPKHRSTLSAVERAIALLLAAIWIVGSFTAILAGLRHGFWVALIVGPLGIWYGMLWVRAARMGRRLRWSEAIRPWR
jgi:hypothetical protein